MSTTFDPNQRYLSHYKAIKQGPAKTRAARIEGAKESFRDEISRLIPPAFRDQIRWSVFTSPFTGAAIGVRWEYPGR